MLTITYTNGDIQNINVTGDFFTITLAQKNGKQVKISPIEKAEDIAHDLAVVRGGLTVSKVSLHYPGNLTPKVRLFQPEDITDEDEIAEDSPSYIKELKNLKRLWKGHKFTQRSVWTF